MHEQDNARSMRLDELKRALMEALPKQAVVRMEDDGLLALDVHAWWIVPVQGGLKQVNSLSFYLTPSMMQTFLHQTVSERASTCNRLKEWAAWVLDAGDRTGDEASGFDICAVVPLHIFRVSDLQVQLPHPC